MTEKLFTRIICSNDEYTGSLYCNDEPMKIDEVCTILNEQSETIATQAIQLEFLQDENKHFRNKIEALQRADDLTECETQSMQYRQKVKETLQEAYNQNSRHNNHIYLGITHMLKNIAKELGVELK